MSRRLTPILLAALALRLSAGDVSLFEKNNLAAWCIVPFDAKKRGPEERAAMLENLGFSKFVYDYRKEHVPTFDAEMEALKRHHIELTGWWFPTTLNDEAKLILDVIKRHGMTKCDLWVMGGGAPTNSPGEQAVRVQQEAARIKPIALEAAKLGVRVGLYNHGSWFGEPENMVAIAEALKRERIANVGIVYNLHHGHEHLARFSEALRLMLPHLICINLNGMTEGGEAKGEKILPLGQGDLDLTLLRQIIASGYRGPIGILNHTNEDAEGRLLDNLEGLGWLVQQLEGGAPRRKPTPRTWKQPASSSSPQAANSNPQPENRNPQSTALPRTPAFLTENKPEFRKLPITVECRAKLNSSTGYNILVASDPKNSSEHWELYSQKGSGVLSVFLPGRGGDFKSKVDVCDGSPHHLAAILEPGRVRLFVDRQQVLDRPAQPLQGTAVKGRLAIGELVGGGLGCDGVIESVRLTRGVREFGTGANAPLAQDERTIGFWTFDPPPAPVEAAPFSFVTTPLHPDWWPHHLERVNRDRVYDFYEKEALHFMKQRPLPALLPEYPGLDGGKYGHWGNQDDTVWRDARWNDTDLGSMMSGVFHGGKLTVPKAVCVRLGGENDVSACFDPTLCEFVAVWKGGFVGFDPARHGFMGGLKMQGEVIHRPASPTPQAKARYHGFYRHGEHVCFAFERGGKEFLLEALLARDGSFTERSFSSPEIVVHPATRGGPSQWPQWIETKGVPGTGKPYALDTLTLPIKNPWKTLFFVTGSDFFSNGDAAICTMTGEVWLCRGIDEKLERLRWKRFATGLHQPLGLKIVDDKICVLGRDQITRLHDLNDDDEADLYECLSNAQVTSTGGHSFITGLERDDQGRFYFASGNQGLCRAKPGGPVEVLATGFRNPNGLGLSRDGTMTTSVQEGDWTPASAICQIKPGGFYGHGGPKNGEIVEPPLIWLPRGADNSCGGQCFAESDRWGPLGGHLIHFSPGAANHFLILREKIGDEWQGAAVPLPGDFLSGAQQGRINPRDGQLYVTGMNGWGVYAPDDGCFQRVRYTGGPAHLPVSLESRDNGVLIQFSDALDPAIAGKAENHFAQCWNYRYSAAYGSPELSLRHPGVPGHDPLAIASAHIVKDGRTLFLEIPQLNPANTIHLHLAATAEISREVFLTAHRLGPPFTEFPGYKAIPKQPFVPAVAMAVPPPAKPNPWREGRPGREIVIEAALGLQFAQKQLVVARGERLSLTFRNPDVVPHNWVLLQRGKLQAVGDLANKLITDPSALGRHYVPDSPDVLVFTDMVNPAANFTIHFTAPSEPGEYPYLCTFPGHWLVMNGVMRVE